MTNCTNSAKTIRNLTVLAALSLALGGCITGAKPFAYTPISEIPPGPGLLTGEDGNYSVVIGGRKSRRNTARAAQAAPRERYASPAPQQSPPPPLANGRMVEAVTRQ